MLFGHWKVDWFPVVTSRSAGDTGFLQTLSASVSFSLDFAQINVCKTSCPLIKENINTHIMPKILAQFPNINLWNYGLSDMFIIHISTDTQFFSILSVSFAPLSCSCICIEDRTEQDSVVLSYKNCSGFQYIFQFYNGIKPNPLKKYRGEEERETCTLWNSQWCGDQGSIPWMWPWMWQFHFKSLVFLIYSKEQTSFLPDPT